MRPRLIAFKIKCNHYFHSRLPQAQLTFAGTIKSPQTVAAKRCRKNSGVVAFIDCSYEGLTVLMVLHCFPTLLPVGRVLSVNICGFCDHQVPKVRYPSWVKMDIDRFPRMRVDDESYYKDDEVSNEA